MFLSAEVSKPVSRNFVWFKHLFSELLIPSILYCIYFESMWIGVDIMVFGEDVADRVECSNNESNHSNNHLGVWGSMSRYIFQIFRHIMCHLRSTRWHSIFILNHSIMQLRGHSNNHMIKVGIKISTFWYIMSKWRSIMITCQQIIRIVDKTRLMGSNLWQFWGPDSTVCSFSLVDCKIGRPHPVMDLSLSIVPLLEVVTFVFLMGRVDSWGKDHLVHKFSLLETLVN